MQDINIFLRKKEINIPGGAHQVKQPLKMFQFMFKVHWAFSMVTIGFFSLLIPWQPEFPIKPPALSTVTN